MIVKGTKLEAKKCIKLYFFKTTVWKLRFKLIKTVVERGIQEVPKAVLEDLDIQRGSQKQKRKTRHSVFESGQEPCVSLNGIQSVLKIIQAGLHEQHHYS